MDGHKETPVADEVSNKPGPFDVQTIKALVQLMARHEMHEIDLREGELRIRLLRGIPAAAVGEAGAAPAAAPVAVAHAPQPPAAQESAPPASAPTRKLLE